MIRSKFKVAGLMMIVALTVIIWAGKSAAQTVSGPFVTNSVARQVNSIQGIYGTILQNVLFGFTLNNASSSDVYVSNGEGLLEMYKPNGLNVRILGVYSGPTKPSDTPNTFHIPAGSSRHIEVNLNLSSAGSVVSPGILSVDKIRYGTTS